MSKRHQIITVALVVCGLALIACGAVAYQQQDENAIARRDYMRVKLNFAQAIMEGLSVQNFEQISDAAREIKTITDGEQWLAIDTPEYEEYSGDLRQSADRLMEMAINKNLEGSALRFFDMTLHCLDCHKYIKGRSF